MQSDSQHFTGDPAGDGAPPPSPGGTALTPQTSRKLAWAVATLLGIALVAAAAWGVRVWQTDRAIANVGSSVGARPLAAPAVTAANGTATPAEVAGTQEVPVAAVADRLPPLVLPGQPVPHAVLRDLPEWVAAELGPAQTSGASGDETAAASAPSAIVAPSAAPASAAASPRRQSTAPARPDRYGAVFARCPGPGESGAVECRRAVCDGAARKSAACAPYLN